MTTLEFLKANRDNIITLINNEVEKQHLELSLKAIMIQFAEYANMGCNDVINYKEDLTQCIVEAVDTVKKAKMQVITDEGRAALENIAIRNEERLRDFNLGKY